MREEQNSAELPVEANKKNAEIGEKLDQAKERNSAGGREKGGQAKHPFKTLQAQTKGGEHSRNRGWSQHIAPKGK